MRIAPENRERLKRFIHCCVRASKVNNFPPDLIQQLALFMKELLGECRKNLQGHQSIVCCLSAGDRFLYSGSLDSTLHVWDANGNFCTKFSGHSGAVTCVLAIESSVFTGSADRAICEWNVVHGSLVRKLLGHTGGVNCLHSTTKNILCSGGNDRSLIVWDCEKGTLLHRFFEHDHAITSLLSVGNRVWTAGLDGLICLWDSESWAGQTIIIRRESGVNCLHRLQNTVLAGFQNGSIQHFNCDGQLLHEFCVRDCPSIIALFSYGKTLFVSSKTATILVEFEQTSSNAACIPSNIKASSGHSRYILSLAIVNGNAFTCAGDLRIRMWS